MKAIYIREGADKWHMIISYQWKQKPDSDVLIVQSMYYHYVTTSSTFSPLFGELRFTQTQDQ